VGGKGKIEFHNSNGMWAFIKGNKGTTFTFEGKKLYYSIDKKTDELDVSMKVSRAVKMLKEHYIGEGKIEEEHVKRFVDGEWNLGIVYVRDSVEGKLKKVYYIPKGKKDMVAVDGVQVNWNFKVLEALDQINNFQP
jgi:hypothetical protein